MGQHSWLYADTKKQLLCNKVADSYLLVPKEFWGKYGKFIFTPYYDGYGNFGKYDAYDLVPEWNKEHIPFIIEHIKAGEWECTTSEEDVKNLLNYYEGKKITCELRWLGIIMACYDEDNERLKYPVKITTKVMNYEDADMSRRDPEQGR